MYVYIGPDQLVCLQSTKVSCTEGFAQGLPSSIETRLIPVMAITCNGTVIGWTVSGRMGGGTQFPKLQFWRSSNQQDYRKRGEDIPVNPRNRSTCEVITQTCGQVFQCSLTTAAQVSVQPGDILGVELPPENNRGFEILFEFGTQQQHVYRQQLSSTARISSSNFYVLHQLLASVQINTGEYSISPQPHKLRH